MKQHRYTFFGGKGGTGKTSLASAWALKLARSGVRTLAVSTDPAHSLSDAMGRSIGSSAVALEKNLWAIEVDGALEARRYVDSIKQQMTTIVSPAIVEDVTRQLDMAAQSPGSEEAAIFDCFVDLMEQVPEHYDAIVFDTAPTGHTLRLLSLPEMLGFWMDHLMAKRQKAVDLMKLAAHYDEEPRNIELKDDPIYKVLRRRQERFATARRLITDGQQTVFHLVLNAERLPILETQRAVEQLQHFGIKVGKMVVNRVIPPEAGEFFACRCARQDECLAQIEKLFGSFGVVQVPWLDCDVQGLVELERLGAYFDTVQ